jgi:uncharacterized protein
MTESPPCQGRLAEKAIEGIAAFNAGDYFEAHELLEEAWQEEKDEIRDLYRGILQIAVCYFHLLNHNYAGAHKLYARSLKWLTKWQPSCRGVRVAELLQDAENVIQTLSRLGPEKISEFDKNLLKPIRLDSSPQNSNDTLT